MAKHPPALAVEPAQESEPEHEPASTPEPAQPAVEPGLAESALQLRAQNNAIEARLRELGMNVDTGRVSVQDLRMVCQLQNISKALVARGLATPDELEAGYQTELHDFLAALLVQAETKRHAAQEPAIATPDDSEQRTPGGIIVPMGAAGPNRAVRRAARRQHTH